MSYPSFYALYGRMPIVGKDYDFDSGLCQDDYEYYAGVGRYSDYALGHLGIPKMDAYNKGTIRIGNRIYYWYARFAGQPKPYIIHLTTYPNGRLHNISDTVYNYMLARLWAD